MKTIDTPLGANSLRPFAWRLRQALNATGNSQQWLADATLLSPSYISRLLSCNRSPSLRILQRLAHVLRVPVEQLWRDGI